jgi:hypothetical protein
MRKLAVGLSLTLATGAVAAAAIAGGERGSRAEQAGSVAEVVVATSTSKHSRAGSLTGYGTLKSLSVTVPAGESARLLVRFAASGVCVDLSSALNPAPCKFRIRVGGQDAAPGSFLFAQAGYQAFNVEAASGPLGAGQHSVSVQWAANGASTFSLPWGYVVTVARIRA